MENLNKKVGKQQWIIAGFIGGILTLGGGGIWWLTQSEPEEQVVAPENIDMTGVVTNSFDEKLTQSLIADHQANDRDNQKSLKTVYDRLDELETQTLDLKAENLLLRANQQAVQEAATLTPDFSSQSTESSQLMPGGSIPDPASAYNQFNFGQPGAPLPRPEYAIQPPPPVKGQIERTNFSYAQKSKPKGQLILSGSYSEATVIEGADANASVTGAEDTAPMQFRLTGKLRMPNQAEYDLSGCFVTAEAYGDISSERVEVRTHRLSCALEGKSIDMRVEGHANFYGKNGIKGTPVMRSGKILGLAFLGGGLEGIGEGFKQMGQTSVGIGATADVSASQVGKSGVGGGIGSSGRMLSDYYIKRAEQYHPVIPIGAGTPVTIVFQKGFRIEYVEDEEAKAAGNNDLAKSTVAQPLSNVPADMLNQAKVQLGEFLPGASQ
ncbi:TrbI/VirB10 family protein [Pseudomonas sp. P5_152]|uniref:TrbI/VirB10 family protein n=1 Tax=Pseudomonas sp. P5_152 TaxID=3043442 RepID=UPI002A36880C|nr:TrbI/VirB10 family protein [Pseudomonas sp. P5_152]MDX9668648.1 TrbI/VirB10 family protein [Pseudomonas sp. P5_152]